MFKVCWQCVLFDRSEPPMAEAATQFLVDRIIEAMRGANKVVVEHDNFQDLAELLENIKDIFLQLEDGGDAFLLEAPMQALKDDLEEAQKLITICTNKSRIYLLLHCRSISKRLEEITHSMGRTMSAIPLSSLGGDTETKLEVDNLAQDLKDAQFPCKDNEARLCQTLEPENDGIRSDVGVQQGILMDIARTVGIEDLSRNPTEFKNELDRLRRDVDETNDPNDVRLLGVIVSMFDKWLQSN